MAFKKLDKITIRKFICRDCNILKKTFSGKRKWCVSCSKKRSNEMAKQGMKYKWQKQSKDWKVYSSQEQLDLMNDFSKRLLIEYERDDVKDKLQKYRDEMLRKGLALKRIVRRCRFCNKILSNLVKNKSDVCNICSMEYYKKYYKKD